MPRLRKKHLPHTVTIAGLEGEGAESDIGAPPVEAPAYVEQKARLVVDRRSSSPTANTEVASSTLVILLPRHDVLPRTKVTVWAGTPRERTSEVITTAFFDYKGTPNHVELWLE